MKNMSKGSSKMGNRSREIERFLKAEVDSIKGVAGFLVGLFKNKIVNPELIAFLNEHIDSERKNESLIAFMGATDRKTGNQVVLFATSQGVYVVSDNATVPFFSKSKYVLDYFISYSEIDSVGYKRDGLIDAKHLLCVYQLGAQKERGWFFEFPLKKYVLEFAGKIDSVLDDFEPNAVNQAVQLDEDELVARIERLYRLKLITKRDRDLKVKASTQ